MTARKLEYSNWYYEFIFSLAQFTSKKIVCKIFMTDTAIARYNNFGENTVQTNKWCLKCVTTTKYRVISNPRKNKKDE